MTTDSTKGRSAIVEPMTYKKDCLVQVWMDSRVVDALSRWIDKNVMNTRYLSEVLRVPLEMVVERLIEEGQVELRGVGVSREMLEQKYKVNLNPRDKGRKNVQHNLTLESRKPMIERVHEKEGPVTDEIKELAKRAMEEFEKLYGNREL